MSSGYLGKIAFLLWLLGRPLFSAEEVCLTRVLREDGIRSAVSELHVDVTAVRSFGESMERLTEEFDSYNEVKEK